MQARMGRMWATLIHCWWECKMVQPLWKMVWEFLTKLNIILPYDSVIVLFHIYPKGLKTCPYKNLHTDVHSSFTYNCQTSKQPRCPSVGEWINELWYIQTMEYYLVRKRNELSNHEKTWSNLKFILLSERRQSEKVLWCMIPTIWHSVKGKTMETIKRLVDASG